jgi:hypothetical protein
MTIKRNFAAYIGAGIATAISNRSEIGPHDDIILRVAQSHNALAILNGALLGSGYTEVVLIKAWYKAGVATVEIDPTTAEGLTGHRFRRAVIMSIDSDVPLSDKAFEAGPKYALHSAMVDQIAEITSKTSRIAYDWFYIIAD